jgi:hypothetical protein
VTNDNLVGVSAFRVSVVSLLLVHGWNAFMRSFACLEVLVLFVKVVVSGGGMLSLSL